MLAGTHQRSEPARGDPGGVSCSHRAQLADLLGLYRPFLGVLLVIFPGGFVWLLIFLAIGFLLGDSAPWALASLVCMPVLVEWLDAPPAIYAGILGMLIITGLKRLEANQRPLPEDKNERRKVLWRRLIFDRDIADHKDWINRKPDQDTKTRNS
jgi:hypothetical protein